MSNVLSRACTLEGRLRTASQAYTKLGEVRSDAEVAAGMVDKTAMLAKDVSAKVRQLDLARVRKLILFFNLHLKLDSFSMLF